MRGELGGFQPGGDVVGDGAVGGVRHQLQPAHRLPAQSQARQGGVSFKARVVQGPGAGQGKGQLAGDRQAMVAQPCHASHVDVRALGVQLKSMRLQIEAAAGRNLAGFLADRHRVQLDGLVGDVAQCPDAAHRLSVDRALVQLDRARAGQRVERPIGLNLRLEHARHRQLLGHERL